MIRAWLLGIWDAIPPLLGAPGGWDYTKPSWWPGRKRESAGTDDA